MNIRPHPKNSLLLFVLFVLFVFSYSECCAWTGTVTKVYDGDTIEVIYARVRTKVRLYGIDCPERTQNFGKEARDFTRKMVFKKKVEVTPVSRDRHGNTLAWVALYDRKLNYELLKAGLAWHFDQHAPPRKLAGLEAEARKNKVGLWREPEPTPPWEFRASQEEEDKSSGQAVKWTVFRGDTKTKIFHRPECRYYKCPDCTEMFFSRDQAIQSGYGPCKICKP
jgi:endonuclease YncB( thermonuclease family)